MAITVSEALKNTQVERAKDLLLKFVKEERFWNQFRDEILHTNLSHHALLETDAEIYAHLKFMFNCDLNVNIVAYKTSNPFSKVLGHAAGNTVSENTRKLNALSLWARVGHLGHEICHLFGYKHDHQGQETSVAVVFGKVMAKYAEIRCREMGLK
jgi:ssRNA-specific RNase YbeY (16S rRNA maturation enzyme)